MKAAVALIAGLALAGSALAEFPPPPIAPIYGVSVGPRGVTVRMALDDCRVEKSDLTVAVAKGDSLPLLLVAPKRTGNHQCRATGASDITWSFEELGLKPEQPFTVGNPLTADPHP
jgi:hypothetical protein